MQKFHLTFLAAKIQEKNTNAVSQLFEDVMIVDMPTPRAKIFKKQLKETLLTEENQKKQNSRSKVLLNRKKNLLHQLKTIDAQLRRVQNSRLVNSSMSRKKTQESVDFEALEKANALVSRMNKQRKQKEQRRHKKQQDLQLQVKKSLKKLQIYKEEDNKQKQEKKKEIQHRISTRRQQLKLQQQYNRKADHLISELQNYRVSLPAIPSTKNPQEKQSKMKQVSTLKRYKKSSFLESVQQEQLNKRRQIFLKEYEKKRVRERQQHYDRKLRKSTIKDDSKTFVT